MKHSSMTAISLVFLVTALGFAAGDAPVAKGTLSELNNARQVGWQLASLVAGKLEASKLAGNPGIEAWLKDFHKVAKGIDSKTTPERWPPIDVDALTTHNPNFWRAYYEIAPGDPALAMMQAGLLLSAGEASRASYLLLVAQQRPGIPQVILGALNSALASSVRVSKESDAIISEGIKLYDQGDYAAAIKKYEKALACWPQSGFAHYEMGLAIRSRQTAATGEKPLPLGTVRINDKRGMFSPEVTAAFAKARKHDPFRFRAYQGDDQEVIAGCMALVENGLPAWQKLVKTRPDRVDDDTLEKLAGACQKANIHELALAIRQVLAARRGRYAPADHPFISTSLRKLAPGEQTEKVIKRLAGRDLVLRQLTPIELGRKPREDETYRNPVDGKTYTASGGWKDFHPKNPAEKTGSEKVTVNGIRLLSAQEDFEANATAEDIAAFVKATTGHVKDVFAASKKPCVLLVQFTCSPTGHKAMLATQGKPPKELKKLHDALAKMDHLPMKGSELSFQIQYTISDGSASEPPEKKTGK